MATGTASSINDITAQVWDSTTSGYTNVAITDFEVHKDPIRTQHSDGNQYRLKINAITSTIADVNPTFNMFGIINTTDASNEHFWLKKCFKVKVDISTIVKYIYLLPMSYNVNLEKSVTYICMEMSERLLELGNFKYFTELGILDFSTFFINRITEANIYLNDLAKLAKKLDPSFNGFKIIPQVPPSTMERASNQINNNNIMHLADQLFELGWFKCPAYASYDSFDLQAMANTALVDNCIITYKIMDLGEMRKVAIGANRATMALYSGLQDQTVKPFFDTAFFDNFINKKATFEFSKYGSWVSCLMDGGLEQGDSTNRIELEALFGSKENMEAKLCCLKQLVAINPQVYSYSLPNQLLSTDFGVYNLGTGDTVHDFIVAINYSTANLDGRTTGSNLTFTTKLKTLKFNYPIIQTDFYNQLNINGVPCLNG